MLKEQRPFKFFNVPTTHMKQFVKEAKEHGLLYVPIRNKQKTSHIEVVVFADDSSKVQRIYDNLGLDFVKAQAGEAAVEKAPEQEKPVPAAIAPSKTETVQTEQGAVEFEVGGFEDDFNIGPAQQDTAKNFTLGREKEAGEPAVEKNPSEPSSPSKSKASPKSEIPFIRKRMTCPYCGDVLQRNGKKSPRIYWDCKGCQNRFGPISDNELQQAVTEKLLAVCRNPRMAEPEQSANNSLSIQAARLTNEFNQLLDQREVDANHTLSLILECTAEKYKTCGIRESDHLTIKIKTLFQDHSNDEGLDRELFEQTVKQVILQPGGSIQFQLLNGKTV